ncbi:MAG: hypothetical protein ACJ8CR_27605 [Roseiflexaceae bacterium]
MDVKRAIRTNCLRLSFVVGLSVLFACGGAPAQAAIAGNWKFQHSGTVAANGTFTPSAFDTSCACSPQSNLELHFKHDGTVIRIGTGPSQSGSYTFVDASHISMKFPPALGEADSPTTYEVIISQDQLILRSTEADQTVDQRYARVE